MRNAVLFVLAAVAAIVAGLVLTRDSPASPVSRAASSGVVLVNNGSRIVAANADGSGIRVLTEPPAGAFDSDPVASPDGELVAFVRDDEYIEVMRVDGSDRHQVAKTEVAPAWSPDGSLLAYETDSSLELVRPDGSDRRVLVADDGLGDGFTWSPNGRSIVFVSSTGISVVDVGTGAQRVLNEVEDTSDPTWSPGGGRIAFLADYDNVVVMNADGSGVHTVAESAATKALAWSPDGTRLAFAEYGLEDAGGIVVVDATSGGLVASIPSLAGGETNCPSWSPDGDRIAFLRASDAGDYDLRGGDVWIAHADGTHSVQLTRGFPYGGAYSVPRWLADAAAITPDRPIPVAALSARGTRQLSGSYAVAAVDGRAAALLAPSGGGYQHSLGIWTGQGPVRWMNTGWLRPHRVALAGKRVYWSMYSADNGGSWSGLWTATWPGGHAVQLRYLEGDPEGPGVIVEGNRSLVVYTLGHSLFRLNGTASHLIRTERTDLWPMSVDRGRVLLSNGRRLEVIDARGRLVTSVPQPAEYVWACLSASRVMVLTAADVRVYQVPTGRLLSARHVGAIDLADRAGFAFGSLLPYQSGAHWHVMDVATGRDRILTVHTNVSPRNAAITDAGLFYTARRPYSGRQDEAGFVPLGRLRQALR
jgi:TolB protein